MAVARKQDIDHLIERHLTISALQKHVVFFKPREFHLSQTILYPSKFSNF